MMINTSRDVVMQIRRRRAFIQVDQSVVLMLKSFQVLDLEASTSTRLLKASVIRYCTCSQRKINVGDDEISS